MQILLFVSFLCIYFYVKTRVTDRQREGDLVSIGSFCSWLQQLELGWSRARSSSWPPVGRRGASSWAFACCFSRRMNAAGSEVEQPALNQCPYGTWCCRWRLNYAPGNQPCWFFSLVLCHWLGFPIHRWIELLLTDSLILRLKGGR